MTSKLRLTLAAVVASAALLGGAATAPVAHAAPTTEALAAKQALDGLAPQPTQAASVIDGIESANALMKKLGITPFTPTLGACTDFTFPSALGGAIPGPMTPGVGDLTFKAFGKAYDLNAVRKGEVLYGFVPVGTFDDAGTKDKSGMRVAWFNVNTFDGGFGEPMGGITDIILDAVAKRLTASGVPSIVAGAAVAPLKKSLAALPTNGARGGIVETGSGTVLSAIYGTIKKGDATCYFFPSLGIATAK
ncbi:hypothetical protein [Gordonia aichiensis]|uniref:hypothetical protein n=1 Tax=Gordonia aichiensis TaxID=36820 RepID=UPI003266A34D